MKFGRVTIEKTGAQKVFLGYGSVKRKKGQENKVVEDGSEEKEAASKTSSWWRLLLHRKR